MDRIYKCKSLLSSSLNVTAPLPFFQLINGNYLAIIFQKAQSHISMVFGQIPNNYSLLVELLYIMHTGNRLRMCEKTL